MLPVCRGLTLAPPNSFKVLVKNRREKLYKSDRMYSILFMFHRMNYNWFLAKTNVLLLCFSLHW